MKRVGITESELSSGIYLSDGVVSLALLDYKTDEAAGEEKGKDFVGVHHFGFWVDDLDKTGDSIEECGGTFFLDLPEEKDSLYYEKKYRDPDGDKIALGVREPDGQFPWADLRFFQGKVHDLTADIVRDTVPHPARPAGTVIKASFAEGQIAVIPSVEGRLGNAQIGQCSSGG